MKNFVKFEWFIVGKKFTYKNKNDSNKCPKKEEKNGI